MRIRVKEEDLSGAVWGSEISMDAWDLEKIIGVAERYVKRKHSVEYGGEKVKDLSELRGKVKKKEAVK